MTEDITQCPFKVLTSEILGNSECFEGTISDSGGSQ